MEDQYGMADLRHYIDGRPFFPPISQPPPPPELLSCHRPFDMLMFRSDSTHLNNIAVPSDAGGLLIDGGAGRWPRQETLTLLEIRSRLDPKFKEANQKGPLWDEVSRIMSEEHGYQRSGKKCREKFENLYKYYKKTREGKAGRQDGKHYRFFRQLEAIYGEPTTNSASASAGTQFHNGNNFPYNFPIDQEAYPGSKQLVSDISVPDSCDTTTTSSYCSDSINVNVNDVVEKKRGKRSLRAKIEQSIEAQMKKMTEKQEAWMEKMTKVIEGKERERAVREEQWRKQDAARIESEHKMWAAERAWIEARDVTLMDAFNKLAGNNNNDDNGGGGISISEPHPRPAAAVWEESEVARLIHVRSGMDLKFQLENGVSEEAVWDEIAAKVGRGDRSGVMCREKWDEIINDYLMKKKRKEEGNYSSMYPISTEIEGGVATDPLNEAFFRYFIGESCHQRS